MNLSTPTSTSLSRRAFVGAGSTATLAGIAGLTLATPTAEAARPALRGRNQVILFQGDSITDAGWSRDKGHEANTQSAMGNGYAWLAAVEMLLDHPNSGLRIFNRGISGHKVFQLSERWERDCLGIKPDVLSILIGVNDYWHTLDGKYKGTVEGYERDYRALIERTLKALPRVRLVLCEPFVLKCGAVKDTWFPEFDRYRAAARRVAVAYHTHWVPFQSLFDQAIQYAPPAHWAGDGVHPSPAGAAIMAHQWLKVVNGIA